jgi:outer membrane biosynthesis protein TonB
MRTGYTISAIGHCLVLAYSLYSYSAKPFDMVPMDSVTADVISDREFSQLMNGSKTALKVAKPLPVVDKIGERKEVVPDPAPKVTEKPEIKVAEAAPPPKLAEPKPPEPKLPEPKPPEAKPPEPKPAAALADPKPEPDPIAEALKKEEAKKKEEARKEEAKKREEAKRREEARKREENKFDIDKIQTALLDKRAPQRQAATGSMVNPTPSLGSPTANAPELSQNEIDALRAQLMGCWNPPVGVAEAKDLVVVVRFSLNRDGSVSGEPVVTNHASHVLFQIAAESATRAVRRCQPFRLPASKYEAWRDVEVKFDPNDMFRG